MDHKGSLGVVRGCKGSLGSRRESERVHKGSEIFRGGQRGPDRFRQTKYVLRGHEGS